MSNKKVTLPPIITRNHHDGRVDKYNVHEILGQGGFGTVFRITKVDTNEEFALKVTPFDLLKKPKLLKKHMMEIEIQRKLSHQNILKSIDDFKDAKYSYIVLELCPHQSIKHLLRKKKVFTEVETASIIREIVNGLMYLHDNRIIHRDLKLENFLMGKDGHVKIADFGLSTKLDYDDQKRFTVCGTPNYLSPEIFSSKGHSYEVDIWAIGVCAFAMLIGKPPFETKNLKLTYEHIRHCSYSFPAEPKLSFVAKDFVQSTLQINPELRPSAQELSLHPFLALADKKPTAHKVQNDQRKKFTTIFPENKPEQEQKQELKQEQKPESKKEQKQEAPEIKQDPKPEIKIEPKQEPIPKIEQHENNLKIKNIINPKVFQQKQDQHDHKMKNIINPQIFQQKVEQKQEQKQEQNQKANNYIKAQILQQKQELKKEENFENIIPLPIRKPLQPIDVNRNENIPNDCKQETYQDVYETAPDYCVSRFCDHSDKYGLGYLLLNGTVGAIFNDSTRMVMDPHENFIQYWSSYKCTLPTVLYKNDQNQKKKILILMKFSESLKKTKTMYHIDENEQFAPTTVLKHVKYWMRSNDSLLFKMDNRTVQVNFNDKMKLIVFWNSKKMMLVSNIKEKGKIIMIHDLPKLPGIDEEKRRFASAKAMLEEMNG